MAEDPFAVLNRLAASPDVAWCARMNTGGAFRGKRYVAFGFKGLSDIIGQTVDGRFLAVEVKRPGENPTPEQSFFLALVAAYGGVSGVARGLADVDTILAGSPPQSRPTPPAVKILSGHHASRINLEAAARAISPAT